MRNHLPPLHVLNVRASHGFFAPESDLHGKQQENWSRRQHRDRSRHQQQRPSRPPLVSRTQQLQDPMTTQPPNIQDREDKLIAEASGLELSV